MENSMIIARFSKVGQRIKYKFWYMMSVEESMIHWVYILQNKNVLSSLDHMMKVEVDRLPKQFPQ